MMQLSYEELYSIIKPCGLGPAKAKNILALSEILVKKIVSTVERTTPDASVYYDQYRNKSYKMVGFPTSVSRLLLDSSISAIRNMKFDELFSGYNRRDLCFRHLWDSEYLMGRRDRVGYPVRKQIDSDSPEIDFTPKEKALLIIFEIMANIKTMAGAI